MEEFFRPFRIFHKMLRGPLKNHPNLFNTMQIGPEKLGLIFLLKIFIKSTRTNVLNSKSFIWSFSAAYPCGGYQEDYDSFPKIF